MKKILLLIAFTVVLSTTTYAALFSYGVKAGLNYGKMSNISLTGNNNYRPGFNAGVYFNASFMFLGIQPELLFSHQVTQVETAVGNTKVKTNYLNLPIMIQWRIVSNIFYVEVGPQLGLLITDNLKDDISNINIRDLNTFDLSLAAGLGVKIPVLPLGFNARYCFGLTQAANHTVGDKKSRNNVFQIGAFWEF